MVARVLVPVDDSEMAMRALRHALDTFPDAEITVLHVSGGPSPMMGAATDLALSDDFEEAAEERASDALDRARAIAAEYDAEVTTEVRVGPPARIIVDAAADFDAVVLGSHSGSLSERLFVGNVAEKVVRRSPVPVTVVR
ncbi:universal stress protein [Haloplanus rubicundus]|uniref:Universal stress protein n=1 Tax=Haloplanus rubicundus TaxID=1547898 RepID=A0A345E5K8_9EURY|nr:universal stress protein [Haloplanus rubicundus]AXG07480.1 universal stress protein [Haloplanus rubicundus]AXG10895.1 universal stress protein [Haloplanus rubicundus]